jgi:integrase/recombinase XerD
MPTPLDLDINAFINHGRNHGWADITVENYQWRLSLLANFLRPRGCKRAPDVTPEDLDAFMQAMNDQGRAKSSRMDLAVLIGCLFRWLQDHGRIISDPSRNLPVPDDGEVDLPEPALSKDEVLALLANMPRDSAVGIRNACLLNLLYWCGLRRGEALRLDLQHVDLTTGTVWVEEGKGGQNRLLPLMRLATIAVKDWLALRRTLVRGPDRGAFFLTTDGKRLTVGSVAALFLQINARRGPELRHLHPHLLRHSVALHAMHGGADIRLIQAFLGHSSINTTKIYLRMVPGRLKIDYDRAMPEIAVGMGDGGLACIPPAPTVPP